MADNTIIKPAEHIGCMTVIHKDYQLIPRPDKPQRLQVNHTTRTFEAFKDLLKAYGSKETQLFVRSDGVLAVLNSSMKDSPNYDDSYVHFELHETPIWDKLTNQFTVGGRLFNVSEFVTFIRNLDPYIVSPNQAHLIKTLENLQVIKRSSNPIKATGFLDHVEVSISSTNTQYKLPTKIVMKCYPFKNWSYVTPEITLNIKYSLEGCGTDVVLTVDTTQDFFEIIEDAKINLQDNCKNLGYPVFILA